MSADHLTPVLTQVIETLMSQNATLATAESCTGGWIAKCCTDRPGSSAWFPGGIVAYSNDAKIRLLGVPSDTLERNGAVSQPVAEAMAQGARSAFGTAYGVGVTGVAGPDGGSDDKPVGTVWIAWAGPQGVWSRLHRFDGNRNEVRWATVIEALSGLTRRATEGRDKSGTES